MSRPKKSGSMGLLFTKMLAAYEYCEKVLVAKDDDAEVRVDGQILGNALLAVAEEQETLPGGVQGPWMSKYISPLVHRWGNDARQIRSAFKFKTTLPTLQELTPVSLQGEDVLFKLPFPECVLVVDEVEGMGSDVTSVCMFIEERIYTPEPEADPGPWYADNGILPGDKFISITPSLMVKNGVWSLLPCEFHATIDRPFDGDDSGSWCSAFPDGTPPNSRDMMEGMGSMFLILTGGWIAALQHPGVAVTDTAGLKPGVKHRAPRNKERRFYEHKLVTIDPLAERCNGGVTGHGGKHRLHPVRGFWRRYKKSGKRVWVRPHWRGDKELGVITHDYEVKHEAVQNS